MKKKPLTLEKLALYFAYLDALRESGVTNMYGASPHLQKAMRIKDRDFGVKILSSWMKTFSRDKSPEERAGTALTAINTPAVRGGE